MERFQHNMALRSVVYEKLCHDGIIKEWLGDNGFLSMNYVLNKIAANAIKIAAIFIALVLKITHTTTPPLIILILV